MRGRHARAFGVKMRGCVLLWKPYSPFQEPREWDVGNVIYEGYRNRRRFSHWGRVHVVRGRIGFGRFATGFQTMAGPFVSSVTPRRGGGFSAPCKTGCRANVLVWLPWNGRRCVVDQSVSVSGKTKMHGIPSREAVRRCAIPHCGLQSAWALSPWLGCSRSV